MSNRTPDPNGVFVIETKHYKGWIFGGEQDWQWTQKIHGGHSQKFQNPLLQNYSTNAWKVLGRRRPCSAKASQDKPG